MDPAFILLILLSFGCPAFIAPSRLAALWKASTHLAMHLFANDGFGYALGRRNNRWVFLSIERQHGGSIAKQLMEFARYRCER